MINQYDREYDVVDHDENYCENDDWNGGINSHLNYLVAGRGGQASLVSECKIFRKIIVIIVINGTCMLRLSLK